MVLFSQDRDVIFSELVDSLLTDTNLTRTSPGSKVRALMDGLSSKLGSVWLSFDLNVAQSFLHGAHGKYLDFLGNMMGLDRQDEAPARLSAADQIVRFFVDSGTFGDINAGANITIESGRRISTGPNNTDVVYFVPYEVILDKDDSSAYIPVQSLGTGTGYNVPTSQLRYHDVSNYFDIANVSLKVINDFEIAYALDPESDSNYRYRIANSVLSAEQGNLTAIRLAILATPGVADVLLYNYYNGIGTFDALIKAVTPTVPEGLLQAVAFNVDKVESFGIKATVRRPYEVGFGLVGTIRPRRRLDTAEETGIIRSVTRNVTDYVNGLDIAEGLYLNELVERVMGTSSLIRDIGSTGQPFDELYIYEPNDLDDNKIRSSLLTNYIPPADGKMLIENRYGGNTPILFRIAY